VAFVVVLLLVDVLLVHRRPHAVTMKEAAIESSVWVALGVSFTGVMYAWHGSQAAGEYLSGYLIEKSLSVDNVFVWAIILSYFAVPKQYQFRVLFWGVLGALVLRFAFIFAGVALINSFEWMLFVFGGFLIITALRLLRRQDEEVHPDRNVILRAVKRLVPSTNRYDGQKMFTRENGKRLATPLFAVLIVVESTDVLFAVDSVPAILAVSQEQFIVFSSNAFAICGLRALYFLLAGLKDRFHYLQQGLAVILAFVGVKMIASSPAAEARGWDFHVPTGISLLIIFGVLTLAITVSWFRSPEAPRAEVDDADETDDAEPPPSGSASEQRDPVT
jgi:tellurite resistance protein TerC